MAAQDDRYAQLSAALIEQSLSRTGAEGSGAAAGGVGSPESVESAPKEIRMNELFVGDENTDRVCVLILRRHKVE
jgi:hypothetical protein